MATTTFSVGDITIYRVVEQEGPFFNPLEFFLRSHRSYWRKIAAG